VLDRLLSDVAHALAHPARITIVRLLAGERECRGADVFASLPLAQSTVSQHLAILRDAGVVTSHPMGTSSVYCLVPSVLSEFATDLQKFASAAPLCSAPTTPCRAAKE